MTQIFSATAYSKLSYKRINDEFKPVCKWVEVTKLSLNIEYYISKKIVKGIGVIKFLIK